MQSGNDVVRIRNSVNIIPLCDTRLYNILFLRLSFSPVAKLMKLADPQRHSRKMKNGVFIVIFDWYVSRIIYYSRHVHT